MTTHFITTEVDWRDRPDSLPEAVEAALRPHGEPLRWAVTAVDDTTGRAQVEAVVTSPEADVPVA